MSPATTLSTDRTSSAYKKAQRQHLKSTGNRSKDVELNWTPFRAAEKKYKARFTPPDLSDVLDVAVLDDARVDEIACGGWRGSADAVDCKEIKLKIAARHTAYIVPRVPGLVLLPSFVSTSGQKRLVRWALCDQARKNETNLDAHYVLPEEGLWNTYVNAQKNSGGDVLVQPRAQVCPERAAPEIPGPRKLVENTPASAENFEDIATSPKPPPTASPTVQPSPCSALIRKLRWANIGWFYHWGTKQYDFSKGKSTVSPEIIKVCMSAVELVDWRDVFSESSEDDMDWGEKGPDWQTWTETYEPDAGIVNFYQTKDTLMAHVDRSEICATSPLVSISLGNAAIFLIGGFTRDTEPIAILLRSGDVVIMSGPACRRAYHGVPRILENSLPQHLEVDSNDMEWTEEYSEYLRTTRINVNVRQVFPKGSATSGQP